MYAAVRALPQFRTAMAQARQMTVVSGPPQVRISFGEKVIHGVTIATAIMVIPAWVLTNIKNYRARG